MKTALILIIGIVIVVLAAGLNAPKENTIIKIIKVPTPMSVKDLQIFLNEQKDPWGRYKCKIDGKFGAETNQALENYLCDGSYSQELKRMQK
ncbi:MAG: hypothetical protein JXA96_17195 [Sedimentisphaerales bacterium]|nr:hypothetical protein [Sedimentisphaerales bacterium]